MTIQSIPFNDTYLAGGSYLVTGASSGLGRAAAELIAACGGRVLACGRDAARIQDTVAGLRGAGHVGVCHDMTNADDTAAWLKEVLAGRDPLQGAFHAAGVESMRLVRMLRQQQIDEVMGASLFGALGLARALSQRGAMADGGAIVFMSSVAGSAGQAGMAAYSAAKAGIDGMVRSLACELAPRRIRVNALAAGGVVTPMHERITRASTESATQAYEQQHLLGFGTPADVANAALFLLGDAGRWVTGTTLVVDGGYLCK